MDMNLPETDGCTALVPVRRAAIAFSRACAPRPDASFVAHLIAIASGTPQTRILRRASEAEALNGYRLAKIREAASLPAPSGMRLSRVA